MKPSLSGLWSVVVGAGLLSGCAMLGGGGSVPKMNASPAIPAAEAQAKFGSAPNGNTSIALAVKHLADPQKLTPPANVYVVWLRPNKGAAPQNIGALTVDKNLMGTLNTVTAMRSFDLFVTAESSGQVQQPTGPTLLWTSHSG